MPVRVACDNEAGCRRITPLASCALREPGPPGVGRIAACGYPPWRKWRYRWITPLASCALRESGPPGVGRITACGYPPWRKWRYRRITPLALCALREPGPPGVGRIAACGYPPWRKWRYRWITPLASCALRESGPPGRRANNRVRLSAVAEVAVSADNAVGVMRPTGGGTTGRRRITACGYPPWRKWRYRQITPLASCALREPGPPGRRANNRVRLSAVAEAGCRAGEPRCPQEGRASPWRRRSRSPTQ